MATNDTILGLKNRLFRYSLVAVMVFFLFELLSIFGPRNIPQPKQGGWEQLRIGMHKDEVEQLLGESYSKRTFRMGTHLEEHWEYAWTDGDQDQFKASQGLCGEL